MSAVEIHNRVRGLEMWPGCHFYVQDEESDTPKKVGRSKSRSDEQS